MLPSETTDGEYESVAHPFGHIFNISLIARPTDKLILNFGQLNPSQTALNQQFTFHAIIIQNDFQSIPITTHDRYRADGTANRKGEALIPEHR